MNQPRNRNRLAIVAYPRLEAVDEQWIESIRSAHDPQASRIGAHFTLVFPAEASAAAVASEVSAIVRETSPIAFTIRRTLAVRGLEGTGGHLFLVPAEGHDRIAALHDRFHEGVLRSHLRADVPFIPHVTIAADPDFSRCEWLARALDLGGRVVRGTLDAVELVDVSGPQVSSLGTFVFGSSSR